MILWTFSFCFSLLALSVAHLWNLSEKNVQEERCEHVEEENFSVRWSTEKKQPLENKCKQTEPRRMVKELGKDKGRYWVETGEQSLSILCLSKRRYTVSCPFFALPYKSACSENLIWTCITSTHLNTMIGLCAVHTIKIDVRMDDHLHKDTGTYWLGFQRWCITVGAKGIKSLYLISGAAQPNK